ncbi:hypothetical protein [Burkholderia cepacia]|uniref:hypothetical protein n=1 Tax=Burkholderia cepacia TaxID=292 RepID=UPI002AAFA869|nr:hypothetical protein [Burkholderia cepacia]
MKPVLPTIGVTALCVICGTAVSTLYFGLIASLCWFISSAFAAGANGSATWRQAAQLGLNLGLSAGFVCSVLLALIACQSVDLPAMRKKFSSQLMLTMLAGAVRAAAIGTYAHWDSSRGGALVAGLSSRHGITAQTVLVNLVLGFALMGVMTAVAICMLWSWIVPRAAAAILRDLIYPFNATKYLVVFVLLIGTIWGLFLPSRDLLEATYKLGFGAVSWGTATLYLCDFAVALAGRNSPYWQKFYDDNKADLYVCGLAGLTLVLLYSLSSERYSWYSLDLAFLGSPFYLYAVFAIRECATIKVAGRNLPLRLRIVLCALFAVLYAITLLILLNVQSKTMPQYEALWYQISIFCGGLSAMIFARQIPFMLKQGKIELSPVLLRMFSSMKFSPGIYAEAARAAQQWNRHVKLEKAVLRKQKARASKSRRR